MVDHNHLSQLKNPKNVRKVKLYQPEGYSTDHRADLHNYFERPSSKKKKKNNRSHNNLDNIT